MATPIILADSRFLDADPTATGVTDGTQLNIRDLRTYTFLTFPSSGTKYITVDCATAKSADCLALAGHNLFSAAASVSVESSSDNVNWTERLAAFTPVSNKACLRTFTTASARYWRVKIVTAAVAPYLAVCLLGVRLTFPYSPEKGFAPISEGVEVDTNDSKGGNPLGVVVRYFPLDIKPQFANIDRTWVDNTYRPFRESYGRYRKYFFWAWDITTYPEAVYFVYDSGSYAPTLSRGSYYDRLQIDMKGVMEP